MRTVEKAAPARSSGGSITAALGRRVPDTPAGLGEPPGASARAFLGPRFGHDFSKIRVHSDRVAGAIVPSDHPAEREANEVADAVMQGRTLPPRQGAVLPAGAIARQPHSRRPAGPTCPSVSIQLRPVFFRSTAGGPPTGATWAARLAAANSVWGRCGVRFTAAGPRIMLDPTHTTAGFASGGSGAPPTDEELEAALQAFDVRNHRAGSGPEVFLVDHDLTFLGGAGTHGTGNTARITMSDRGANVRLLAHELGHVMGMADFIHFAPYARGTVMEASRSNAIPNHDVVTSILCGMLTQPSPPTPSCFHPDPTPAAPSSAPERRSIVPG